MITLEFLATVVLVSASGVMGPGPLFLASTLRATKQGTIAGLECAIGHTLIEFPLVVGLAVGLQVFLEQSANYIALIGGVMLLVFAALQFLQARRNLEFEKSRPKSLWAERSGVAVGIAFTALNPFFILWWATVGASLTAEALVLGGFVGVLVMFAAHIWMDYAWLGGTASFVGRGKFIAGKWYRIILVGFGVAMIYFGISFIVSALT